MYIVRLKDLVDGREGIETFCRNASELSKLVCNLDSEKWDIEEIYKRDTVEDYMEFCKKTPGLETGNK
jgi:hypothetical protein